MLAVIPVVGIKRINNGIWFYTLFFFDSFSFKGIIIYLSLQIAGYVISADISKMIFH